MDSVISKLKNLLDSQKLIEKNEIYCFFIDSNHLRDVFRKATEKLGLHAFFYEGKISYESLSDYIYSIGATVLISTSSQISILTKVLWECQTLKGYICIDNDDPFIIENHKAKLMNKKLWDIISKNAENDIERGGWISSYTREHFSEEEVNEFSENVLEKVLPLLGNDKKKTVFEIGCASGFTMFRLLPHSKKYIAIDLSELNVAENIQKATKLGFKNFEIYAIPADKLGQLSLNSIDLVIANSVIHCFVGLNYLRKVIKDAIRTMSDHSWLFIGDIIDVDRKEQLYNSLYEFKQQNPQYNTKLDLSNELFETIATTEGENFQYRTKSRLNSLATSKSRKFEEMNEVLDFLESIYGGDELEFNSIMSVATKNKFKS